MDKPKHNRRKYIVRPRVGKKLIMAATASVMAVTIAASLLMHALKVSVPAEAQHALSGVSEAIKDHGSGEAFVILDIVPGSTEDGLSLGTIGYLTSGQSPLEQSLSKLFKADDDGTYNIYEERMAKADGLADEAARTYDYKYRESLTGGSGWTKIYDGVPWNKTDNFFANEPDMYTTIVYGIVKPLAGGAYVLKPVPTTTVELAADNAYFTKIDGTAAKGYRLVDSQLVSLDDDYADDTHVYILLEDGTFQYFGKKSDIPVIEEEEEEPGEEEPEEKLEEDGELKEGKPDGYGTNVDGENQGDGAGGDVIDGSGAGDGGNGTDGSGAGDGGNGTDGSGAGDGGNGTDGSGTGDDGNGADGSGTGDGGNGTGGSGTGDGGNGTPGEGGADEGTSPEGNGAVEDETDTVATPVDEAPATVNETQDAETFSIERPATDTDAVSDSNDAAGNDTASLGWIKFVELTPDEPAGQTAADNQPVAIVTYSMDMQEPQSIAPATVNADASGSAPASDDSTGQDGADATDNPGGNTTSDNNQSNNQDNNQNNNNSDNQGSAPAPGNTGDSGNADDTDPSTAPADPDAPASAEDPASAGTQTSPSDPASSDAQAPSDDPAPSDGQKPAADPADEEDSEPQEYYVLSFEYVSGDELRDDLWKPSETVLVEEELEEEDGIELFSLDGRNVVTSIKVEKGNELVYVGEGYGEYAITQTRDGEPIRVYNAPTYFRCYDEDLLKKYVFCNSALNIKVNVKSAADVTIEDVKDADLIYLEDISARGKISYISGDYDMSASVVFTIIDRAVNDLLPVIVDYNVSLGGINTDIDGKGDKAEGMYRDTNYQKLADILLMTDTYSFFQEMEDVTTMLMNAGSGDYGNKSDNDYNYVNNNIYVTNPAAGSGNGNWVWDLSNREDFTEAFGNDISGFEEVKAAINMENKWYENDDDKIAPLSKATALQYIINYANGYIGEFRDFAILELQPTSGDSDLNTRNDSRNNTILYWKRPGAAGSGQQLVRSRKLITIDVDTESVAQFSGEQRDINDTYQMVFIGLDGQRLNYEGKDTVYNDSGLNGKVYSGVGDIADGGGQRYEGVDITPQKKETLLEFMRAGYPIVVENDFFVDKTAKEADARDINTKYIDESSQMYDFLRLALSENRDCIYTIADIRSNTADFAAQINVHRPRIVYDEDNAAGAINPTWISQNQVIQTVSADAEGKYRGYIPYKVMDDTWSSYQSSVDARFYLDMNLDGRFDALEEVTGEGISINNGLLTVEFAAPERGSIPWKLEISDTGNRYRRDALTGYFEIRKPTQISIRVVQVVGGNEADSHDAKFNFEDAYRMSDMALLGYYLKGAEAMTNTELEIDTMTVGQLAEELKLNGEYLSGADVLVLGFGPEYNLNVPVVDRNVEWYVNKYISEGRGVLLSSAASSEAAGRLQLNPSMLGQKDVKTYSSLGKSHSGLYKYSTLKPAMFDEWSMLSAAKANDGAVSHYPYEVGENVTLGNNVGIADYTLDLASNGASDTVADVTAWYCLGDVNLYGEKTSYGVSVKDASNNYYIYSKGSVVYVGESGYPYAYDSTVSPVPAENTQGTDNCKLFVNALMEAYNVGIKNPKVAIVAGLADDSSETDSICIPYDEQIKEIELDTDGALSSNGVLDDTVDVYFRVTEPNLAFRKDVTLAFYYEDDLYGAPIDVGGRIVNATPFGSEIWTVEQNQLVPVAVTTGLDLVPGKIYKIKAPVISLKVNDNSVNADIYIVVQSHFIKLGQDRHPIGSDSVTLNRAQLFLLE